MKSLALLTLICTVPFVTACCALPDLTGLMGESSLIGSGNMVTKEFDLSGFDRVNVSDAFDVEITQGGSFSVVVRVDDNFVEYLDIVKRGGTLNIELRAHSFARVNATTMEAEVTMPELTGLGLSGASDVSITGFASSETLSVHVSGASSLRGDIESGDSTFDVSGASHVSLSGSGGDLGLEVSGASDADLAEFDVGDASVQASGASSVTVNASGTLDVSASGASHVHYLGTPTLGSVESSGASTIQPR